MSQEFGAVLVTGLAIFGLVFVATQVDADFLDTEPTPESQTLYQQSYGKVGDARADSRPIRFGSFTVGEGRGDILAYRDEREDIRGKLLSSDTITIDYEATQPRGGVISFEVLGKQGNGPLYVLVNGNLVFEEHLVVEGTPEIEIPQSALKSGENTIVIGARKGGLISSTSYTLEDIQVRIDDRKFHDYINTFQMFDYELEDFVDATLTFNIENAVKTQPLNIYVNGRKVYELDRVRGPEEVRVTPANADLHPGLNTVKFETDGEARYEISNAAMVVRYVGRTQRAIVRSEFEIPEEKLDYAARNDTQEAISFDYQNLLGSQHRLIMDLNGYRNSLIPVNGHNQLKFPAKILENDNILIVRSNGTFQLNNLKIGSELVEE